MGDVTEKKKTVNKEMRTKRAVLWCACWGFFFFCYCFKSWKKTHFVLKWTFISLRKGNKKLKMNILSERKIFHLTSEKH